MCEMIILISLVNGEIFIRQQAAERMNMSVEKFGKSEEIQFDVMNRKTNSKSKKIC